MKSCCNKQGKVNKGRRKKERGKWAAKRKGETRVAEKRRERRVEGDF